VGPSTSSVLHDVVAAAVVISEPVAASHSSVEDVRDVTATVFGNVVTAAARQSNEAAANGWETDGWEGIDCGSGVPAPSAVQNSKANLTLAKPMDPAGTLLCNGPEPASNLLLPKSLEIAVGP
jgi:hypothetical protein